MRVARVILLGLVAGPLAVLLVVWVGGCAIISVDRGKVVADHEAVLKQLPQYPGAKLGQDFSIGQSGGTDSGPPYKSFSTYRYYQLPHPVPGAKLMSYFHHAMGAQWKWGSMQNCNASFTGLNGFQVYLEFPGCTSDVTWYRMVID